MYRYLSGALVAGLSGAILLASCGSPATNADQRGEAENTAAANANTANNNVEELGVLIDVPYESEDTVWKENASHKKITAVFRFSPEDSNKVVADASAHGAPQNVTL